MNKNGGNLKKAAGIALALGGIGLGAFLLLRGRGSHSTNTDSTDTDTPTDQDEALSDIFELDEKLTELRDILTSMEAELSNLAVLLAEQDAIIASLLDSIAVMQDLLGQQETAINNMLASIATIDDALAVLNVEETNLRAQIGEDSPALNNILVAINTITAEVNNLKAQLSELQHQRDLLVAEVNHMNELLTTLEALNAEAQEIVANLQSELTEALALVDDLEYQLEPVALVAQGKIYDASRFPVNDHRDSIAIPFTAVGYPIDIAFECDKSDQWNARIIDKSGTTVKSWATKTSKPSEPTALELSSGPYILQMYADNRWMFGAINFSAEATINYFMPRFLAGETTEESPSE